MNVLDIITLTGAMHYEDVYERRYLQGVAWTWQNGSEKRSQIHLHISNSSLSSSTIFLFASLTES